MSVRIVSAAEAELSDMICCKRVGPSPFKDNLIGHCFRCGKAVMYRPYMPKTPPKVCIQCAIKITMEMQITDAGLNQ